MKAMHYILCTILLGALLAACETELPYTPKELPYTQGSQDTLLVMNALLDANETENLVHLSLSSVHRTRPVTQATVTLYINGRQAEVAEEVSGEEEGTSSLSKAFRLGSRLQPGDHLRLEAVAEEGRYRATGETTVPHPLESIRVDTFPARVKQYGSYSPARRFQVTVHDPAGTDNYYRLGIGYDHLFTYTDPEGNVIDIPMHEVADIFNQEDVVLTDGRPGSTDPDDNDVMGNYIENRYNVFTDNRFAGTSYNLRVYTLRMEDYYVSDDVQGSYTSRSTAVVRLYSLNATGYQYLRTLNTLESDNYDTTLMEPAIIPSNVTGGLGLVDACAAVEVRIPLPVRVSDGIYTRTPAHSIPPVTTP